MGSAVLVLGLLVRAMPGLHAQEAIPFESGGLRYLTLTRNGVTVMFAHLPNHVRGYSILQVAVSNGSQIPWTVKVADFQFERTDGGAMIPARPKDVVTALIEKARRPDVIKLFS